MKQLSWFNKTMYFFNIVLTILTLVAYTLPYLAPKLFPILAVLTLFLPLILIANALFFLYWFIQLKSQMLLSGMLLLVGITFINKFYKFSDLNLPIKKGDFKVMSYNVRLFNKFGWSEKETIPVEISDFVKEKKPDILCIQEFSNAKTFDYSYYKYKFIHTTGDKIKTGHAIFSNYKIINTGDIIFTNSNNNAVFADLVKGKDTLRVYSMHLESLKISLDVTEINTDLNGINKSKSSKLFRQISKGFKQQQLQSEILMAHQKKCTYPIIICGDMNNSAYSYVYRNIKGDLNDCFVLAGVGTGKTYDFKYYPARIDYIFSDKSLNIKSFESFSEIIDSDHFPIMARFGLEN